MKHLGHHILVEYYDCSSKALDDVELIESAMREAAVKAGATIIESVFHTFTPQGVSGVVVISESHLAIHTWPEYGYAAVDLFTCGEEVDPWKAFEVLKERLKASNYMVMELKRGKVTPDMERRAASYFEDKFSKVSASAAG